MNSIVDRILEQPETTIPFMVLFLPLFGFIVLALFGDAIRRDGQSRGGGLLACGTVLTSFGLSVWTARALYLSAPLEGGLRVFDPALSLDWIDVGGLNVPLRLLIDPLTAIMMLTVTGVGSLIHIYSVGYMSHDEEMVRYFSYLNLFTFFMLLLVMGGSLPLLFVGWEGVGLCSYLLIGFWYRKQSASDAGKKAFIVNRIGDAGLILGMALAFQAFSSLDLYELGTIAGGLAAEPLWQFGPVTIVCLLLFVGACGKSAQIPLHVWLPDAMEGPTPVSALIHAATMVTAGVYMVARLSPLFRLSETAMMTVAVLGTATALMAATVALVQTDIKRVLAYSTVSQLGYMFLACGVGAFGVGVFHLFTHAFFKALLFLGSGSVIHALSGEQDMRKMGGLRQRIPVTFWTFVVGTLAIAGIPPFAGFYSKDEILAAALHEHPVLFTSALLTAALTTFYMFRLLFLTFFGAYRGTLEGGDAHAGGHGHADAPAAHGDAPAAADDHAHGHGGGIHESPWSMLVPLILLAVGAATVGQIAVPHILQPAFRVAETAGAPHGPGWMLPLILILTAISIIAAVYFYVLFPGLSARVGAASGPLPRILEAKWGFDIAFDWIASAVVVGGSARVLWRGVDTALIDGAVNGSGALVRAMGASVRTVQTGLVRAYALVMLGGAVVLFGYLLWRA